MQSSLQHLLCLLVLDERSLLETSQTMVLYFVSILIVQLQIQLVYEHRILVTKVETVSLAEQNGGGSLSLKAPSLASLSMACLY